MSYDMKKIKEADLAGFLLNPFEKVACFGDKIIQKYTRNQEIDDFICLDMCRGRFTKIGFILYENEEIIVDKFYALDLAVMDKHPFIMIDKLRERIKEMVQKRLDEVKIGKMNEIKKTQKYAEIKDLYEKQYVQKMIFEKLGSTRKSMNVESFTYAKILKFVHESSCEVLAATALGSMVHIEAFIDELIGSNNFLAADIIQPEFENQVNDYVEAGKFTKREQILIDYLEKTDASGAKRFTVETIAGIKHSCWNKVNEDGKVACSTDSSLMIDIEDVDSVKYCGKVIYKKNII